MVSDTLEGAIVSSHYFLFEPHTDSLDRRFLDYFIRTPAFREQVTAQGSTNYAAIRPRDVLGYTMPLPPLPEQWRIVGRIEELAGKIEEARGLRREAVEQVEDLLSSARDEAFNSEAVEKFRMPLKKSGISINANSCDPRYMDNSPNFLYLDIGSVSTGPSIVRKAKSLPRVDAPSRARRSLHTHNIIMSTVRPYLKAFALVGEELEGAIASTGFAVLECGSAAVPDFLLQQICSSGFVKECMKRATGGHYPAINDTNLREVEIVVPPLPEQERIVAYLDGLQAKVDALKALQGETETELAALLPSVLDRAFSGRL